MTPTRITGKEYPVNDILCSKFIMQIPRYQRPYAWGVEQAQTLLEDLIAALGDMDDDADDIDNYFLGSIVLVKQENHPSAEVVDGQQRVTTLTILLSVIRSLISDPKRKQLLTKTIFQEGDELRNESDNFFLTLRDWDARFFQEHIQRELNLDNYPKLETDSQRRIIENGKLFVERLKEYDENHLWKLAKYIINNCYLIIVTTPNRSSAHRIFEILNDRGLDLSFTDILKADLIGKIGEIHIKDPSVEVRYNSSWEKAEEQVGRDGFRDLLGHIRTICLKQRLRGTILQDLQRSILPKYPDPADFIDTILLPYKTVYDEIKNYTFGSDLNVDSPVTRDINFYFRMLRWIENSDWMPPAMLYLHLHRQEPAQVLRFMKDLERLAACLNIRRAIINTRQTRYNELISWIENGSDLYTHASPLQLSAEETEDFVGRLGGDVYYYTPASRNYILRRLNTLMSEDRIIPETQIFTIEHVLPQHPANNSQWAKWYPDPILREKIVHKIGNLALLSKRQNTSASNYDFQLKKEKYFGYPVTPFALTTSIVNEKEWTQPVFERRHKMYIDLLKKAWRLEA